VVREIGWRAGRSSQVSGEVAAERDEDGDVSVVKKGSLDWWFVAGVCLIVAGELRGRVVLVGCDEQKVCRFKTKKKEEEEGLMKLVGGRKLVT
jgi:metal-dependent hydrolase (beta-lactamase superfamily II)